MKRLVLAAILALALSGCGSAEEMSSSPSAPPKVVKIVIKDRAVTPQGKRVNVEVGQNVTLNVTSDADDEIHVHSTPEHEFEIKAGTADKNFTFVVKTPGQIAVESHHLNVTILQLVVRK